MDDLITELITKDYILNNWRQYAFKCKDNVSDVRKYLEEQLGFKHAKWSTSAHLNLTYLYIATNREVHGTFGALPSEFVPISIDHLIYPDKFNSQLIYGTNLDISEFKKVELI